MSRMGHCGQSTNGCLGSGCHFLYSHLGDQPQSCQGPNPQVSLQALKEVPAVLTRQLLCLGINHHSCHCDIMDIPQHWCSCKSSIPDVLPIGCIYCRALRSCIIKQGFNHTYGEIWHGTSKCMNCRHTFHTSCIHTVTQTSIPLGVHQGSDESQWLAVRVPGGTG